MAKGRTRPPGQTGRGKSLRKKTAPPSRPSLEAKRLAEELETHRIELAMGQDELQAAQAELEASRNRYSDLYDLAPVGYFSLDSKGVILEINLTGADKLGVERKKLSQKPFHLYVVPEDKRRFLSYLASVFKNKRRESCEIKVGKKSASFHVQLESVVVTDAGGGERCLTAMSDITALKKGGEEIKKLNDGLERRVLKRTAELEAANRQLEAEIIERKRVEEALAEQAHHDALTGLYNRRYFDYRAQEEINRAQRQGASLAMMLFDLDHFKAINDTLGHQAGDRILKAVSKGIQDATRGIDLVFRWGGDEIVAILTDTNREGALISAERVRKRVQKIGEEAELPLDISVGVALFPEHGATMGELISAADRSLYIAKKGVEKVHIGDSEYLLDERSVHVAFQSIVDIETDQVIGYEALSRDPQGKLSVQELFNRYDAIGRLDELKALCFHSQLRQAQSVDMPRGELFLNVDFNMLRQIEPPPKPEGIDVILEISESEVLRDIQRHILLTEQWRTKGYQFAIDDFGAGFVSLPFIFQLVPDYIKMDQSTILQAVSSQQFRRFLKELMIALGNYVKIGVIAEGIETEEELQVVKEVGIRFAQGFLFGKPIVLLAV